MHDELDGAGAKVWGGVVIALVTVSGAAILIRLADAAPLAVAFWRNVIAVGLLLPVFLLRREELPRGRSLWLAVASGAFLALHFGLWITSLHHTSVAASVVLVCTQPIFVALLGRAFLKERVSVLAWLGIALAFLGCGLIASADSAFESAALGNALALGGSVAVTGYVLVGRFVRSSGVALLPYAVVVYSSAALALLPVCWVTGTPLLDHTASTWGWLFAIALGPQIFGHTIFNWALRYLKAAILSGFFLLEPVLSTLLAWLFLAEIPAAQTLLGGGVVLFGLGLLVRGREVSGPSVRTRR